MYKQGCFNRNTVGINMIMFTEEKMIYYLGKLYSCLIKNGNGGKMEKITNFVFIKYQLYFK